MNQTLLSFAALLVLPTLLLPASVSAGEDGDARASVAVKTDAARAMRFVETVTADGSIAPKNFALVSPKITGALDEVFVREGMRVERGITKLFQIDNVKLEQAVRIKRQDLELARSTLEERTAALESVTADVEQAERDYARNRNLYESRVMTLSEFEQSEAKLDQLLATQKVNRMQVVLAEQTAEREAMAVELVARDFDDSIAIAPIGGVVTKRLAEPGEMGMPGMPVVRIDDVDRLKAVAHLPGQFYPRVKPGDGRVLLSVNGKDVGAFPVTYKSASIDSAYRTFEIWADVPGDGEFVVPGAQCVVSVVLMERDGVGVPRDAVQFRGSRHRLFLPDNGRARMIEVKPGLEQDGYVELLGNPVEDGQAVIVQGQFLLDDGAPIRE